METGFSFLGLVDETIDGIGMLLGAVAWEIGVVTVVEWPFVRLASFPLCKLARRCLVRSEAGFFIVAVRILLGSDRFILNLIFSSNLQIVERIFAIGCRLRNYEKLGNYYYYY